MNTSDNTDILTPQDYEEISRMPDAEIVIDHIHYPSDQIVNIVNILHNMNHQHVNTLLKQMCDQDINPYDNHFTEIKRDDICKLNHRRILKRRQHEQAEKLINTWQEP
jgi:hypothetical protein